MPWRKIQTSHRPLVSFLKISGEGRLLEAAEVQEQVSSTSSLSELKLKSDSRLSDAVLPDVTDGFVLAAGDTWGLEFLEIGGGKAALSSGFPINADLHPCNLDDWQ